MFDDFAHAFAAGGQPHAIDADMKRRGGLLAARDLAEHSSDWVDPISTTYRGHQVLEMPPNTQGVVALEMLNILEGFNLRILGHNSAEYLHLLVEAKALGEDLDDMRWRRQVIHYANDCNVAWAVLTDGDRGCNGHGGEI